MSKFIDKLILWVANRFGTEEQMIPSLHTMPADKVIAGRMYEWYGRVVKPLKNPNKVETTYYIWPNKDMSTRAVDIICNNTDKLQILERIYRTCDDDLAEELKKDGSVEVTEETTGEPCSMCCMDKYGLPCPSCRYKYYWVQVAKYKQNCTDQEAYMRIMEKKINGTSKR